MTVPIADLMQLIGQQAVELHVLRAEVARLAALVDNTLDPCQPADALVEASR